MKNILALVVILVSTLTFGSFVAGLGGLGLSYGITAGITSDDFTFFGYSGPASLFAVIGTGVGIFADFTPFELFAGTLSEKEYRILLGGGAGISLDPFVIPDLGLGVTIKTIWGKFITKATTGFGLMGLYADAVVGYTF